MNRVVRFVFALLTFPAAGCLLLSGHDGAWPCEAESDCDSGERCRYPVAGNAQKRCLRVTECDTANACAKPQICVSGTCEAPDCASTPCDLYACDVKTNRCRTSCEVLEHCEQTGSCQSGECVSGNCTSDKQCAGGYKCANRICETTCKFSGACAYAHKCVDSACVFVPQPDGASCENNDGCVSGICNAKTCRIDCSATHTCSGGKQCIGSNDGKACTTQSQCICN